MSIFQRLAGAAAKLLPQSCLLCGEDAGSEAVCSSCVRDLPGLPTPHCPLCALPTAGGEACGECLRRAPHFDASAAVFTYAHPADKLVHALKYSRRLASAEFLAKALLRVPFTEMPDLILPVPLGTARLAERGFNQAVELARPVAQHLGRPLELAAVRRVRDTTAQASLPWKSRHRNVRHAFECQADLTDLSIWLIDDVMTTGATLDELARILKLHGARRVENRVVARALRT